MSASPAPSSRWGFTVLELLVVLGILAVLVAFMLPSVRRAREPARRSQCQNYLHQIALALHNYHDTYGEFPPAYTVDAAGNRLHSWRTLLLPYVDQQALYDSIDLSKSWDDPVNVEAFKKPVPVYVCPSSLKPMEMTLYQAVITPNSCLRGERSAGIRDITDGTANTLMVIEVDPEHAVPWMSPNDADESVLLSFDAKTPLLHRGIVHALFADGDFRALSLDMKPQPRRAMVTIDGKDEVDPKK